MEDVEIASSSEIQLAGQWGSSKSGSNDEDYQS